MRHLILWIINAGTLVLLPYVLPGISVSSFGAALVTALVLLTLPITLLTLGLFILVINALLFWMVASFVPGFQVLGFASAFWGAIAYSIVSTLVSWLILG